MSAYKIAGMCSLCDTPCFEIVEVFLSHELYPGEPKRVGGPLPGAIRVDYLLMDGSFTTLTFCKDCEPTPDQFGELWNKSLRSWRRELKGDLPAWYVRQFANGLLCEQGRHNWTDLVKNG